MFIRYAVRALRERLSICVCASFPFGFEGLLSLFFTSTPMTAEDRTI